MLISKVFLSSSNLNYLSKNISEKILKKIESQLLMKGFKWEVKPPKKT